MQSSEIRQRFLRFFEERGHLRVPSSSLIPPPETGLLLTTAGMVQFIPSFLGRTSPPAPRITTVQKAFRTTDIDNVGHTARHLTFFEMLGNFSFGDYFKKEACRWGHELVTEGYGIDHDRLWVTVFDTDDEAIEIWAEEVGISRDRIVRRGWEDNYWWTHAAGPGGPSSEIFVDRGPRYGPEGGPAVDEERFLEIWNLVFMQHEVDHTGEVVADLPSKNIDTGSSLERVAMAIQDADSFYETDLVRPLVAVGEEISGSRYGSDDRADLSLRILAEHGRATSMLIADGVQPSNEGRGYVLRRMLRRAVTHARRLGIDRPVMPPLAETTIALLSDAYPELVENREYVLQVAGAEEERFRGTLRQGLVLFEDAVARARPSGRLSGADAFRLHDTHGFQIELTTELAEEQGLEVDLERFQALMDEQRRRAQEAVLPRRGPQAEEAVARAVQASGRTEFVGYERLMADSRISAILVGGEPADVAGEGDEVRVLLAVTPFYAEGGGQVGDRGEVRTAGGVVRVTDARWDPSGEAIIHLGTVVSGEIRAGKDAHAEVEAATREATARSHTATHVLHWTLRHLLGEHARQAGSLVAPGRLRFDFSHHEAVPREVLEEVEYTANRRLSDDSPVRAYETTFEYAKSEGAIALFGERYGSMVRVVEVGDYSRELCGGTHVPHTGRVALVRLLHEAGIGAGMRRIEAVVGPDALRYVNLERRLLEEVVAALGGGDPEGAPNRARRAVERIKQLESELGKLRKGDRAALVASLADQATRVDGVALVLSTVPGEDADGLRELAQALRSRLERDGAGAAVLGNGEGGRALLVAACTPSLVERGVTAPALLEPAARTVGGGTGGKPILAFAGGRNAGALSDALGGVPARLSELLKPGGSGG
jgi:alanyl-tRNA synthetase